MSQYEAFTITVDDEAVKTVLGAVYGSEMDTVRGYEDPERVRVERILKDKVYEALERVYILQSARRR